MCNTVGNFKIYMRSVVSKLKYERDDIELLDNTICTVSNLQWMPAPDGIPHTAIVVIDDDMDGIMSDYLNYLLTDQSSLEVTLEVFNDGWQSSLAVYRLEKPEIKQITLTDRNRYTSEAEDVTTFTIHLAYNRLVKD